MEYELLFVVCKYWLACCFYYYYYYYLKSNILF